MASKASRLLLACAGPLLLQMACAAPPERSDSDENLILEERAREYFDERFRFYPVEATAAGVHAYDGDLGQFGAAQVTARILQLRDLRQRLLGVDLASLSRDGFVDALWLTSMVKAELFELEQLESWRNSPVFYSDVLCGGVASLIEPWESPRVEALLSRLEQVPVLLEAAVENLQNPSPLALEEGVSRFQACRQNIVDLPTMLKGFLNDTRANEIASASREAGERVQNFILYLQNDVVAGDPESFRWGEEKLRVRLLYREMEETPPQTIRLLGERELDDTKEQIKELETVLRVQEVDEPLAAVVSDAVRPIPFEEDLVSATGKLLEELRQAVSEREMVPAVSAAPVPAVRRSFLPSPEIARLVVPGPLDPSGEAVFLLAPRAELRVDDPARPMVPYEIQSLARREIYPGRYVRFVVERSQTGRSDLRRLLVSRANGEGWAHDAEARSLDELRPDADPHLKMAVLHDLALEQARLVITILLHAGDLSLSTAAAMFAHEADLDPLTAEREARRAALDPDVMSAELGRLQVSKLRRDFLDGRSDEQSLASFQHAFFSCGELPIRLVRLLLLSGGESQTLED